MSEVETSDDQGFNDEELADIMKEIEDLEEEFQGAEEVLEDSPEVEPIATQEEENISSGEGHSTDDNSFEGELEELYQQQKGEEEEEKSNLRILPSDDEADVSTLQDEIDLDMASANIESVEESTPVAPEVENDPPSIAPTKNRENSPSMQSARVQLSSTISTDFEMKLSISGQDVVISIEGDNFLVKLESGAIFSVPLK